jgi:hypothetical protein
MKYASYSHNPIILKSNYFRIDSWQVDPRTNKPLKTKAELFKDLLPGDFLLFSTKLESLGGSYTCNFKVEAFRNDEKIGEITKSQNSISNLVGSYFELTECL